MPTETDINNKRNRRERVELADAIAPGWERRHEFVHRSTSEVRQWMVERLAPHPGETVLDLAAGAGDVGFELAPLIGDAGRLISSDFSAVMIDVCRRHGEQLGVTNVEHRVIDGVRNDLESETVDTVSCRFGYMLWGIPKPLWLKPAAFCDPAAGWFWRYGHRRSAIRSSRPRG